MPQFDDLPLIRTINFPPPEISECLSQARAKGFPLSVADCIYLFVAELFADSIVNIFPFPKSIVEREKIGLPM